MRNVWGRHGCQEDVMKVREMCEEVQGMCKEVREMCKKVQGMCKEVQGMCKEGTQKVCSEGV